MKLELLFDRECPNVIGARENISHALRAMNLPVHWIEWDQSSDEAPAYVRQFGSPTVLVDGHDIAGIKPGADVSCCRIYEGTGVPSAALIRAALEKAIPPKRHRKRHSFLAVPGIVLSALPFGGCPACWPVYGGALSALGLGFLLSARYLFPLTSVFLLVSLFTLGLRASTRRGYGPLAGGLFSGSLILYGKFSVEQNAVAYSGVVLLIASSLWNAWPKRYSATACPDCVTSSSSGLIQLDAKEKYYEPTKSRSF